MTERQALKVSGLLDELRKRAEGMGFSPEQIEPALVVTGLSQGRAKPGKEPFKVLLDFLVKDSGGNRDAGRKRPNADKKSCPAKKTSKLSKQKAACAVPSTGEEPLLNADDAVCCVCGSGENEERMILCDKCPLAFHLECLSPPLDAVPEGDWFCSRCQSAVDTGQAGKKSARNATGKGGQAGSNKQLTARSGGSTSGGRQQTKAKTAFELFFLDQKDELLAAVKGESFGAIQKKVKQAWEDLSPAEQEEWHAKSKRLEAASVDGRRSEGNEGKTSSKAKAQKSLASPADHAQAKGSKKVSEETGGKCGRTGCAVQKGGAVKRKMDSHDSDPNWLGFVFDPASLEPLAEECFAGSTTLQVKTAEARAKMSVDKTIQSYEAFGHTTRWPNMGLPALMHKELIHDWQFVVGSRRVYPLPMEFSVRAVTSMYASSADVVKDNAKDKEISTRRAVFAESLCHYFDAVVRIRLLYNTAEIKQHDRLKKDTEKQGAGQGCGAFSAADVYGAEHLIRLLSCLPELLGVAHPPQLDRKKEEKRFDEPKSDAKPSADATATPPAIPDTQATAVAPAPTYTQNETTAMFHDLVKFLSNNFDTFIVDAEDIQRMM